jgi:hypothetical protein
MITAEEIRKRFREHPFRPFRIHLTDGRHFDIKDPTWHLALEPLLIVGLPPEGRPSSSYPAPGRSEWVPYKLVERIEPLPVAVSAA